MNWNACWGAAMPEVITGLSEAVHEAARAALEDMFFMVVFGASDAGRSTRTRSVPGSISLATHRAAFQSPSHGQPARKLQRTSSAKTSVL